MKKIIISLLLIIGLYSTQFLYAEETTWPEITNIKTIYNNWKWELFINWLNFWDKKDEIEVIIIENYWKENEEKTLISTSWVYEKLIVIKIEKWLKNWILLIRKISWEKDWKWNNIFLESNKERVDFWLPEIRKIEAPKWIWWWKYIIIEWVNFKKPTYWKIWGSEYICLKEDENSCKFKLPLDEQVSWDIWIKSLWFEDVAKDNFVEIFKQPRFTLKSYSENMFIFYVKNYTFKNLREIPKKKDDVKKNTTQTKKDWYQSWKKWAYLFIKDWNWSFLKIDNCTINSSKNMNCFLSKKVISYEWLWHLDFFWSKSTLFNYKIKTPQPISSSHKIKWSTYKVWKKIIEWNVIEMEIKVDWINLLKKKWLEILFNWTKYIHWNPNLNIEKNKITIKLSSLPWRLKWEIYIIQHWIYEEKWVEKIREWWTKSKSIWYDLWDFKPEITKVYSWNDPDTYIIEWDNMTNFNNQAVAITFWKWSFWANVINSSAEKVSKDFDWIYWWEVVRKSNKKIELKVFDLDEFKKSLKKWEHDVSITVNWIQSNIINFYLDPKAWENKTFASPKIDKIYFPDWQWNPSKIFLLWSLFEPITEIFFSDEKVVILERNKDKIVIKIPENIPSQWPITMKLSNWKLTNTVEIYKFSDKKDNKIYVNWKKNKDLDKLEISVKNYYKKAVLKNLKLSLINKKNNSQLAFYNISIDWFAKVEWVINEEWIVNFEAKKTDWILELTKGENEEKIITLNFDTTQSWYWEYELKIEEINFYDENYISQTIKSSNIILDKDSYFYTVKDKNSEFCIKKDLDWEFKKCSEVVWKVEEENFTQTAIKSDFYSPQRDLSKKISFSDIWENDWYKNYVEILYQKWVINWYWDWTFKPWNNISRAEAVKILLVSRGENISDLTYTKFAFWDVPNTHWAKNALEYAVRNTFLTATKTFYPDKKISRAEAVKLITRFFWRKVVWTTVNTFGDTKWHWAEKHIEYLYKNWIVSWTWNWEDFEPNGKITRAAFSKMINKSLELWSK